MFLPSKSSHLLIYFSPCFPTFFSFLELTMDRIHETALTPDVSSLETTKKWLCFSYFRFYLSVPSPFTSQSFYSVSHTKEAGIFFFVIAYLRSLVDGAEDVASCPALSSFKFRVRSFIVSICLSWFGLLSENTIDWMDSITEIYFS